MSKKIKELELNTLRKTFKGVRDFVLLEPLKLDSAADYALRKSLRDKKVRVKMVKNSFVRKVFDENGMKVETGSGPTLLCWGGDSAKGLGLAVNAALKLLRPDPKQPEKVKEKTGVADGEMMPLAQLAKVPTKQEAIGEVVAAILGPGAALAGALGGPGTQLAGILKALEDKRAAGVPPAERAVAIDFGTSSQLAVTPGAGAPSVVSGQPAGAGAAGSTGGGSTSGEPAGSGPRPSNSSPALPSSGSSEEVASPPLSAGTPVTDNGGGNVGVVPDARDAIRALEHYLPVLHGLGAGPVPASVEQVWTASLRPALFRSLPATVWLDNLLSARGATTSRPQAEAAERVVRRLPPGSFRALTEAGAALAPQNGVQTPPDLGVRMKKFILIPTIVSDDGADGGRLVKGRKVILRARVAAVDPGDPRAAERANLWAPRGSGAQVSARVYATGAEVIPVQRFLPVPPVPDQFVEFALTPLEEGPMYVQLALVNRYDDDVYTVSESYTVAGAP